MDASAITATFWLMVVIVVPIWAGIASGNAVASWTHAVWGWIVGFVVFWIVAVIAAGFYRAAKTRRVMRDMDGW